MTSVRSAAHGLNIWKQSALFLPFLVDERFILFYNELI